MSVRGNIDRHKGLVEAELAKLEKDYAQRKAGLEARLKDLQAAAKLVTPEIEAVVEKLGIVLGQ